MGHRLVCIAGPQIGQMYVLDERLITIGRDPASTFQFDHRLVSFHHAEIRYENGQYTLYDLGSDNGTFVNEGKILVHRLESGDQIGFADSIIRFEALGDDTTLNPPVRLLATNQALRGKIFALSDKILTFGRDEQSTIRIDNKLASRRHAEIRYEGGDYILSDKNSQNGTFVDGKRLTTYHVLHSGEQITIANQNFLFEVRELSSDLTQKASDPSSQPLIRPGSVWDPLQVVLEFRPQGDIIHVQWRCQLWGVRNSRFRLPYKTDELPTLMRALDAIQYPNYPEEGPVFDQPAQALLTRLGLWHNMRVVSNAGRIVGRALYNGLAGKTGTAFTELYNYSVAQNRPISYIFQFPENATQLAALPWELLCEQEQPLLIGRLASLDSCERYISIERPIPLMEANRRPLHILALSPEYGITSELREEERDARLALWKRLKRDGRITYDELRPLTRRSLTDYLRSQTRRPDIIHYFGHGAYRNGTGYLYFDDGQNGTTMVSTSQLTQLFGGVPLIVLYGCQSSRVAANDSLLTGLAPALSLVAGAVVGMQFTVSTQAAVRFSEILYDSILEQRRSLQEAVAEGRQALYFEEEAGGSWFVPALYIRGSNHAPFRLG